MCSDINASAAQRVSEQRDELPLLVIQNASSLFGVQEQGKYTVVPKSVLRLF